MLLIVSDSWLSYAVTIAWEFSGAESASGCLIEVVIWTGVTVLEEMNYSDELDVLETFYALGRMVKKTWKDF